MPEPDAWGRAGAIGAGLIFETLDGGADSIGATRRHLACKRLTAAARRGKSFLHVSARLGISITVFILQKVFVSDTLEGMNTTFRVRPADLADWLLAHGLASVTTDEAAALMGVAATDVRVRLRRHMDEFVSPARGLWVPVPPEYREWGAPEGIEIIDLWMGFLRVDYYIGWLSAAALHGTAHHAPQTFQVAVARDVRDREVGRTRFAFTTRSAIGNLPRQRRSTRSGTASVSTPEVTALDLAADVGLAGGIDNMATVLLGLVEERLDLPAIAAIADRFPASAVRRLGWILENLGDRRADELRDVAVLRAPTESILDPAGVRRGHVDRRWLLRINTRVEAEF